LSEAGAAGAARYSAILVKCVRFIAPATEPARGAALTRGVANCSRRVCSLGVSLTVAEAARIPVEGSGQPTTSTKTALAAYLRDGTPSEYAPGEGARRWTTPRNTPSQNDTAASVDMYARSGS